jgi:hypothetical protein
MSITSEVIFRAPFLSEFFVKQGSRRCPREEFDEFNYAKYFSHDLELPVCHLTFLFIPVFLLQNLEDKERKHSTHKEQLNREHRFLRRRLEQLSQSYALSKRRSLSECSSSTVSSNHSTASLSSAPSPISESGKYISRSCGTSSKDKSFYPLLQSQFYTKTLH